MYCYYNEMSALKLQDDLEAHSACTFQQSGGCVQKVLGYGKACCLGFWHGC